jgi:hypothetical protein
MGGIPMAQISSTKRPPCEPLPKHKMAILTFFGLLAPVHFIPNVLYRLFPGQAGLVTLVAVGIIVALMLYLIMQILTWAFRGWIAP